MSGLLDIGVKIRKSARNFERNIRRRLKPFRGSQEYWVQRYKKGQSSGSGSYGHLAEYKAEVINNFLSENDVLNVIEYGCGDGNQLMLAEYSSYIGYDVSPTAISICKESFGADPSKSFRLIDDYAGERADLTLSLDVVFHLIEDEVFNNYLQRLFDSSNKFVIIYSSNTDNNETNNARHVKHRKFTDWIDNNRPNWKLIERVPNKYTFNGDNESSSFADFYIFQLR